MSIENILDDIIGHGRERNRASYEARCGCGIDVRHYCSSVRQSSFARNGELRQLERVHIEYGDVLPTLLEALFERFEMIISPNTMEGMGGSNESPH